MHRKPVFLACAASLLCNVAAGQTFAPRSMDYLFAATVNDARAIWLNPAGLAVAPEASIMAEFVVRRRADADLRLSQLSLGFNSRGISFGYYRERLVSNSSNHTYRIALARALQGWTVGVSVSHFRGSLNDTGFDTGIRYSVLRSLDLGVVLRNIGQPQIRSETLPLTGVASLGWTALHGTLVLTGETLARSRLARSGYDMNYRAGAQLSVGRAIPIAGLTVVHLNSDLGVVMWSFGLSVGGDRKGILIAGVTPGDPAARLETLSLTSTAKNQLTARWR